MKIFRIPNPEDIYLNKENQLSAFAQEGNIKVKVLEKKPLKDGRYTLIGTPYQPRTEMNRAGKLENDVLYLDSLLKYDHTQYTPIYTTLYNRIYVYVSLDGGKTFNQVAGNASVEIDWSDMYTIFKDTNSYKDAPETPIYNYSFYGAGAEESEWHRLEESDSTGIVTHTDKSSFSNILRMVRQSVYGDSFESKSDGIFINGANYVLNRIWDFILDNYSEYAWQDYVVAVTKGVVRYMLPMGVRSISDVRLDGCTIKRMAAVRRDQTCNQLSCEDPCKKEPEYDPCACPVEPKEECKDDCACEPTYRWILSDNMRYLELYPVPEKEAMLQVTYTGFPEPITKDTIYLHLPPGFERLFFFGILADWYNSFGHSEADLIEAQKYERSFMSEIDRLRGRINHLRYRPRDPEEEEDLEFLQVQQRKKMVRSIF